MYSQSTQLREGAISGFLNYIQHQLLYFIWAVPYDGVTTNEA